jgi:hypothetical protein
MPALVAGIHVFLRAFSERGVEENQQHKARIFVRPFLSTIGRRLDTLGAISKASARPGPRGLFSAGDNSDL